MNKQKGITLVALIITIIVMLILVGVVISVAINGGLFTSAKKAAKKTNNAKIFEQIQMAVVASRKVSDEIPYEELFDLLDNMKNSGNLDEGTYALYEKFLKLMQQDKPVHAYFRLFGLNDSDMETIDENLDNGEILEAYCKYATIVNGTEFTKTDLMELLQQEEGITTEEEGKKYIVNMFTESSKVMKGDIRNSLQDWQTNDLNRSKLLKELEPIMEEYKEIKKEEFGTNIIYDERYSKYKYTNDWAIVLRYGGVKVTILGTGEIIGPEEEISEAAQDPVVGDITDGGKRPGSQYSPYLIASIEDLVAFSNSVNEGNTYEGKYIELAIDLDFKDSKSYKNANSTQFGDLNEDGTVKGIQEELTDENGKGFTPIGIGNEESQRAFNGNFNGNYHKIKNIYINNSENVYLALFAKTESATIENLGLEGGKIINSNSGHPNTSSKTNYVAGIVGSDEDNGYKKATIKNCFVDLDEIKGANAPTTCIAGIALEAEKIEASYNKTNITSNYEAFGIAWSCNEVIDCYNIGNISVIGGSVFSGEGSSEIYAEGTAAGISNFGSTINCYNAGTILSQYTGENVIKDSNKQNVNAVGIIYASYGRCVSCFNLGVVIGDGNSYGITAISEGGKFTNCYNTANITSKYGVACGIASSIYDEQDAGKLMNTGKISGKTYAYGLTRYDDVSDSYYLAGQVYVDGVQKADDEYAKTQEEMDSLMKPILEVINSTVTSNWGSIICEGNAFVEDTNNINNGLPILKWQVEH